MLPRQFVRLSALSGIVGVAMLVVSFNINPGPPPGATGDQLVAFGQQNYASILWGAWLQAVGPVFIVAFAFAIVVLARATSKLSGIMTFFGGVLLSIVSLIEISFYIGTLSGSVATALFSLDLIHAVQHLYFIVGAPALFFPLGFVVLESKLLPRLLGFAAIFLGGAFAALGLGFLYVFVLPFPVLAFAGAQAFWWLASAVIFAVRPDRVVSLSQRTATNP